MTEEPKKTQAKERGTVGEKPVGLFGILFIMAYFILTLILLLYSFVQFWPSPTAGGSASISPVTIIFWTFSVSDDTRMLLIVALAGALGSLVHALRSFYWYVGNRTLVWSWLAMYILLPFVGATLGVVFYLVIRGGFFSPQATVQQISPFGFAAVAALAGLFSEQAVLKLKQVAETLLTKAEEGKNSQKPGTGVDAKMQGNRKGRGAAGDEHEK